MNYDISLNVFKAMDIVYLKKRKRLVSPDKRWMAWQ
jgi:hypothetical protein